MTFAKFLSCVQYKYNSFICLCADVYGLITELQLRLQMNSFSTGFTIFFCVADQVQCAKNIYRIG